MEGDGDGHSENTLKTFLEEGLAVAEERVRCCDYGRNKLLTLANPVIGGSLAVISARENHLSKRML